MDICYLLISIDSSFRVSKLRVSSLQTLKYVLIWFIALYLSYTVTIKCVCIKWLVKVYFNFCFASMFGYFCPRNIRFSWSGLIMLNYMLVLQGHSHQNLNGQVEIIITSFKLQGFQIILILLCTAYKVIRVWGYAPTGPENFFLIDVLR